MGGIEGVCPKPLTPREKATNFVNYNGRFISTDVRAGYITALENRIPNMDEARDLRGVYRYEGELLLRKSERWRNTNR